MKLANGWSSRAQSPAVNAEQTIDFIPEFTAPGQAKSDVVLYRRPGLSAWGVAGTGPYRASFEQNGRGFVLSGARFYEVHSGGTFTLRGSVAYSTEPGSICGNGTGGHQIMVVSAGNVYIYDTVSHAFAQVTDPDLLTDVVMGFFIKGSFGVIQRNTRKFQISAAYDGLSWSALDIAEKSQTTDDLVAAMVDEDQGELWLIGSRTCEVWWYSGAAGFPLEPIPGRIVPIGSGAPFSWIDIAGTPYGFGEAKEGTHVFVRFRGGYTPERISTHALEAEIQEYDQVDDAYAFGVEYHGHRFYVVTFPSEDATHVFDEASGGWTRWSLWDQDLAMRHAFLGQGHIFIFGQHLVGSRADGTLYELSGQVFDDDGAEMRSERIYPAVSDGVHRLRHNRLTIDAQLGVGLSDGQGEDPVMLVDWSDDGAQTFGQELQVSLGRIGQRTGRAEVRRLGLAEIGGRNYRIVVTDPVVAAIATVDLDAQAVGA